MKSQFVNKIYGIGISNSELCLERSSYTLINKGLKPFFGTVGHERCVTYLFGSFGLIHRGSM